MVKLSIFDSQLLIENLAWIIELFTHHFTLFILNSRHLLLARLFRLFGRDLVFDRPLAVGKVYSESSATFGGFTLLLHTDYKAT